jgi:hypothetical protein
MIRRGASRAADVAVTQQLYPVIYLPTGTDHRRGSALRNRLNSARSFAPTEAEWHQMNSAISAAQKICDCRRESPGGGIMGEWSIRNSPPVPVGSPMARPAR